MKKPCHEMIQSIKTIKCKYCGFESRLWYTTKRGKHKSGWFTIAYHVIESHPEHKDEAERLIGNLPDDYMT